jgi:hypothetical protein
VNFGLTGASFATINVISDTQLTVTSPAAAAGVVNVVVGLQAGETSTATAADQFTYANLLTPQVDTISPSSGPEAGGTPVTITGLALTGATAVRFGATVISDTNQFVVNPGGTQITMNTPPGTGTVIIRVTTPGGTSFPSTAFTYLGAPTVTGVMPGNGPAAGGTDIVITGTNLTGATAVTIGGAAATNVTPIDATTLSARTPAGTAGATASVRVTTPVGTSADNSLFLYDVAALPPTVSGVSPANGPASGGTSVAITGTLLIGATAVAFGSASAAIVGTPTNATVNVLSPVGTAGHDG